MSVWDGEERFSLLLLEEDEYYFRDHSCLFWKDAELKIPGHLKVCSNALYFVPRAVQEPIYRIPYRHTLQIGRVCDEEGYASEDTFYVTAEERVSLKMYNRNVPYVTTGGLFEFRFQLVYTSLEEQLVKIKELWDLASRQKGKERDVQNSAKQRLSAIIQAHEESEGFNPGWLEDENERIVAELPGSCVTPLCSQPGRVALTATRIYFQPFNISSNSPVEVYQLNKAQALIKRTYLLKDIGLEIFFSGRNSLYLTFKTSADREKLAGLIEGQAAAQLQSAGSRRRWTRDWQRGRVSNFEYLMFLNREAGRSFKDLTQYPVFPWIIQDYSSPTLDLSNPAVYRDLSRPIGALNPKRFNDFLERYREQKEMNSFQSAKLPATQPLDFPPFLYGCHYSTPGYVVFYLMRSQPQLMLRLQNGRFDAPDRLFWSIKDTWNSVMTLPTDVKELIPEFYSSDHMFLVNGEGVDFGERTSGARVGDVDLPPWATDAADFAAKLAEALESPQVSQQLHLWIDLIFGCKSQGPRAEKADNVFHYLTYDSIALQHLERETEPTMREALRVQMMEFGRTPKQLLRKPHPRRRVAVTGGTPAAACCGCFGGPSTAQAARPAANVLHPTFVQGRSARVSAVSKAVDRLPSKKRSMREATLAWLESAARTREPEYLQLSSHTELLPILKAAQDPAEPEMREVLTRALRALAVSPLNCSLILDAGGLEALTDMLCGRDQELAHQALVVLSLLSKEDDQRLGALPLRTIENILALLPAAVGGTPRERVPSQAGRADSSLTGADVRMAAASTVANLSRSLTNRNSICSLGGPIMLLAVAQQEDEVPTVRREAITALVAVLEDDKRKIELADRGGLPVLVELSDTDDAWLRDLRAASMRCLALLSTADALKLRLADAGALPLLCTAAHPSGEPEADAELQRPAAAALANLCSEVSLAERLVEANGMEALSALSESQDRQVQEHTARAFWHLAVADSDAVFEAVTERSGLVALLKLAAPEVTRGAQLARQALRRLCEDSEAGDAMVTEIARMNAGQRSAKSASAYLNHLIGTPHNSQYNTPNDTPSGSQTSASPFRLPAHLLQSATAGRDVSGVEGHPQGSPALVRRRHKRIGSSTSLDSRSSQPSPLKRGDLTASLPAAASTSLHVKPHEDVGRPSGLSKGPIPVNLDEAPRAAVIGENEGRGMPDMDGAVPSEADPLTSSQGTLAPQQVIARTVREAGASMQAQSAEARGGLQSGASSSQPSLLPNGQRGHASGMNGRLQAPGVHSTTGTPE